MIFRFRTLTLECRRSVEKIDFSPQISCFHGEVGSGKSSIARLIDFCLGADLVKTTAISQELVSAQLHASIGNNEVLFKREAEDSNQVEVMWKEPDGPEQRVLAPIQPYSDKNPIWENRVYNLSDLIFHLQGIQPMKVRRAESKIDSKMVSLSFRDVMWYCYLEQSALDSSFFRLESPFLQQKSRHVIRFVTGAFTERLAELETKLSEIRNLRKEKAETAKQIRLFLEQFGYSSDKEITAELERANAGLLEDKSRFASMQREQGETTHFADELRERLRALSKQLSEEEQVLFDLNARIAEQESLKAELLTVKSKLGRVEAARAVLESVSFELCPACGTKIESDSILKTDICPLCKQPSRRTEQTSIGKDVIKHDLDSRIDDLAESLERHNKARAVEKRKLIELREEKNRFDKQLEDGLKEYDSRFLANSRDLERRIAGSEERIKGLIRILEMPKAVTLIEQEVDNLLADEEGSKRDIQFEKEGLERSKGYVQEIEDSFLESLIAVGIPGINEDDRVRINSTTWIPEIRVHGNETLKWSFGNAGSGGKKTLFNACFALAVHKIAAKNNLPLPSFLIIDTPMKNIGEDVNKNIFESFYTHLYDLAEGPLSNTQFIIIDKEYFQPKSSRINVAERYMTPNDPKHPPLITYYRGA